MPWGRTLLLALLLALLTAAPGATAPIRLTVDGTPQPGGDPGAFAAPGIWDGHAIHFDFRLESEDLDPNQGRGSFEVSRYEVDPLEISRGRRNGTVLIQTVPEPATAVLVSLGLGMLTFVGRPRA